MGHGVKKETYINADPKTSKALTFDMLDKMYSLLEDQIKKCDKRFVSLEGEKPKNSKVAAISGLIGGIVTVIGYQIKDWLKF